MSAISGSDRKEESRNAIRKRPGAPRASASARNLPTNLPIVNGRSYPADRIARTQLVRSRGSPPTSERRRAARSALSTTATGLSSPAHGRRRRTTRGSPLPVSRGYGRAAAMMSKLVSALLLTSTSSKNDVSVVAGGRLVLIRTAFVNVNGGSVASGAGVALGPVAVIHTTWLLTITPKYHASGPVYRSDGFDISSVSSIGPLVATTGVGVGCCPFTFRVAVGAGGVSRIGCDVRFPEGPPMWNAPPISSCPVVLIPFELIPPAGSKKSG